MLALSAFHSLLPVCYPIGCYTLYRIVSGSAMFLHSTPTIYNKNSPSEWRFCQQCFCFHFQFFFCCCCFHSTLGSRSFSFSSFIRFSNKIQWIGRNEESEKLKMHAWRKANVRCGQHVKRPAHIFIAFAILVMRRNNFVVGYAFGFHNFIWSCPLQNARITMFGESRERNKRFYMLHCTAHNTVS